MDFREFSKQYNNYLAHNFSCTGTKEDFLMHYGVKGMEWGKRKDPDEYYDAHQRAARERQAAAKRNGFYTTDHWENRWAKERSHRTFNVTGESLSPNKGRNDNTYRRPEDIPGYVGKYGPKSRHEYERPGIEAKRAAQNEAEVKQQLNNALNAVIRQLNDTNARQRAQNAGKPEKQVNNQISQLIQGFKEIQAKAESQRLESQRLSQLAQVVYNNMDKSDTTHEGSQKFLNDLRRIFAH